MSHQLDEHKNFANESSSDTNTASVSSMMLKLGVNDSLPCESKESSERSLFSEALNVNPTEQLEEDKSNVTSDLTSTNFVDMLNTFKKSAVDKDLHLSLLNDSMFVSFLNLCLMSDVYENVQKALEIFHLLSQNEAISSNLNGMSDLIRGLTFTTRNKNLPKDAREFAEIVLSSVKDCRKEPLKRSNQQNYGSVGQGNRGTIGAQPRKVERMNKSAAKEKLIELYVPICVNKEKRAQITRALVNIHGIRSITFNLKKLYCVIRAKVNIPNDTFGQAIADLGYECYLVSDGPNEERVLTLVVRKDEASSVASDTCLDGKENSAEGQYLSDSDQEHSLHEPLAVIPKGQENSNTKNGWFSSAISSFQKSFYW